MSDYDKKKNPIVKQIKQDLLSNERYENNLEKIHEDSLIDEDRQPYLNHTHLAVQAQKIEHLEGDVKDLKNKVAHLDKIKYALWSMFVFMSALLVPVASKIIINTWFISRAEFPITNERITTNSLDANNSLDIKPPQK